MLSPYRIQLNNTNKRLKKHTNANFDNKPHRKQHFKRPQMTSNDLKTPQSVSESFPEVKPVKSKNRVKGGANIQITDKFLDEILHKNNS